MKKFFVLLLAIVATIAGCGSSFDSGNETETVSATAQAVTVGTPKGTLQIINGTYGAGCTTFTGSWSAPVNGFAGALTNQPLKVVKDNVACTLTVTSIVAASGTYTGSIGLSAAFQPAGILFTSGGNAFYANARITPNLLFAANFIIDVLYSADADAVSNTVASTSVVTGTATANEVPAPNYTLAAGGYLFEQSSNVITNSTGTATFNPGSQTAEQYVIVNGNVTAGNGYQDVHAAFNGATAQAFTGSLPFSAIAVVGQPLGNRSVILRHSANGIASYQTFVFSLTP